MYIRGWEMAWWVKGLPGYHEDPNMDSKNEGRCTL